MSKLSPEQLNRVFWRVPNLAEPSPAARQAEATRLQQLLAHPDFLAMRAIERNPQWPVFAPEDMVKVGMAPAVIALVREWERLEMQLFTNAGFTSLEIYAARLLDRERN